MLTPTQASQDCSEGQAGWPWHAEWSDDAEEVQRRSIPQPILEGFLPRSLPATMVLWHSLMQITPATRNQSHLSPVFHPNPGTAPYAVRRGVWQMRASSPSSFQRTPALRRGWVGPGVGNVGRNGPAGGAPAAPPGEPDPQDGARPAEKSRGLLRQGHRPHPLRVFRFIRASRSRSGHRSCESRRSAGPFPRPDRCRGDGPAPQRGPRPDW
jgi:hypothetical protein